MNYNLVEHNRANIRKAAAQRLSGIIGVNGPTGKVPVRNTGVAGATALAWVAAGQISQIMIQQSGA